MSKINKIKQILLILILLLIINCGNKINKIENFDPNNKIVYVEDADGKGGSHSFDFCDIFIYDINTGEKIRMTNDKFYDYNPSWSPDGKKILFESKRIFGKGNRYESGLSVDDHIFILDIEKGEIEQIDKDFEKISGKKVNKINQPSFSYQPNKIAFYNNTIKTKEIIIYNIKTKTIINRIEIFKNPKKDLKKLLYSPIITEIRWSPSGNYICYLSSKGNWKKSQYAIDIVNIKTGEIKSIYKKDKYPNLGEWIDEKKILISYGTRHKNAKLIMYNITNDSQETLVEFNDIEYSISSPSIDENLENVYFFIDKGYDEEHESNIWRYNLKNKKFTKLTDNRYDKGEFRLYK